MSFEKPINEGAALLALMFNKLTIEQKNSVQPTEAERVAKYMTSAGYSLVFDRWYKQWPGEDTE